MNRSREPTQVIDSSPSPSSFATEEATGLSKIKATALLLKQKIAGTNTKPQKVPNKISTPWSLTSSSRSNSFSASPASPYSHSNGSSTSKNGGSNSKSTTSLGREGGGIMGTAGPVAGVKKDGIKAMIAAREDPSLSCNKMAPPGTQPAPAPQKRDMKAGMTKVQLTPQKATQTPHDTKKKEQLDQGEEQLHKEVGIDREPQVEKSTSGSGSNSNTDLGKRSTRRRNAGSEALVPSQFAAPSSPSATPLFMQAFQNPPSTNTTDITATAVNDIKNTHNHDIESSSNIDNKDRPTKDRSSLPISISAEKGSTKPSMASVSSTCSIVSLQGKSDTLDKIEPKSKSNNNSYSTGPSKSTISTPSSTTTTPTTSKTSSSSISGLEKRPSNLRRHTTSNSLSSSSSSLFDSHAAPPVPHLTHQQQLSMSQVNPTLRQLQTPQIPMNLVQARILQREEQKRRDEELAKIPITANLRTVKKIQAVVLDDDDEGEENKKDGSHRSDDGTEGSILASLLSPPRISSGSVSLGVSSGSSRPRAKTTTSSTVTVSTLLGGKQRGDRNRVEPVVIPKKLAEQVEHILGRKLAGKGNVLDEREQMREEEEARKAAEPLPPIVRGQPRKRAMTSTHIRNLVSSWDHKVEEAKEITSEAAQIKQFLEQRSTAHAELPKFSKVPLTGSELLKPLPSLPPPPPTSSNNKTPKRVSGHAKAASSTSPYMSSQHFGSSSKSTPTLKTSPMMTTADDVPFAPVATWEETTIMEPVPKITLDLLPNDQNMEASKNVPETSNTKLNISPEVLETKRSGQVLDNKAVINRPRRAGARRATTTTQQ